MITEYPFADSTDSAPPMTLLKNCRLIQGTTIPTTLDCPERRLEAFSFLSYPRASAASKIAFRVDSLTLELPARALDTVEGEIFNDFAMSEIVTIHL